ncbi:MAG: hypothetical protein IJ001_07410 [Oscillospiraceae bacterium]|nr:hypothetical protein [Oscillospiraceae bacterium]
MNAQMNENVKAATSPAPYFWYDHIQEKICGTELNFKKSGDPGSAQDKALMCAKREHPNYGYDPIKPQKEKNSYKGMNLPLMHDYLDCFGTKEMMDKFQQMKNDGTRFPAIKSWFLDLFPKFNVEKAKKEIREYRLGKVKAKYKVVKADPKNRKPSSNIAELPMASGE